MDFTDFNEFWEKTRPMFNSCPSSSRYAAIYAWDAALDLAIQLMRDRCEEQCIPELEEMKATL
jgi:hypothetical protein